jgi:hypothetical protein
MIKKIHYCKCRINLSGQNYHTVVYDEFNPVTWPEVQVLMQLHGEENVMDIQPVSIGEAWPSSEKERLVQIYGYRVVESCFPGRAFRMDLMMTGDEQLPPYVEGQAPSTKVHPNGGDDEDDGEDETIKAAAPVFKPGRNLRPQTSPAEPPQEA